MAMTTRARQLHLFILVGLLAVGCEVKERPVGRVVVRPDTPDTRLVGLADVFSVDDSGAEEKIALLRTFEFVDEDQRRVIRVYDKRGRPVGYVTDDGKAYRVRAHSGQDLVAVSPRLEDNVAAVLSARGTRLRIKPLDLRDQ